MLTMTRSPDCRRRRQMSPFSWGQKRSLSDSSKTGRWLPPRGRKGFPSYMSATQARIKRTTSDLLGSGYTLASLDDMFVLPGWMHARVPYQQNSSSDYGGNVLGQAGSPE